MHVDTDDLATLLKMQHLDLEAMRDKKKLEELPQRAVILEARSKKKAIEQNHLTLAFPGLSFADPRRFQLQLLS